MLVDTRLVPIIITFFLFLTAITGVFWLVQLSISHTHAYFAAPMEIATFLDILDFSTQENDSYKRDDILMRVRRMEDRVRLEKLLREIHKCGENLRDDLKNLVFIENEGEKKLRIFARFFWLVNKSNLQEQARRLDLLRTRFLVIYFEFMANKNFTEYCSPLENHDVNLSTSPPPLNGSPPQNKKTPCKSLTPLNTTLDHRSTTTNQKHGWTDVLAELQRSPLLQKRHNLSERSSAQAPT